MKRFQECNRLEKIWRYRWYLLLPYLFIRAKFRGINKQFNNKVQWGLHKSTLQGKMKWHYTKDEVMKNIAKRREDIKQRIREEKLKRITND